MTGMRLYMIDTESVINEVRARECLWNPRDESYKNKVKRQMAWRKICEAVSPNYGSSSKEGKRQIERALQSRWKTARDAYMKCRTAKKKSTYRGKNKYVFYNALTFLEQVKGSEFEEVGDESLPGTSSQNDDQTDPLETEQIMVHPRRILRPSWQRKRKRNLSDFESKFLNIMRNNSNTNAATNTAVLQEDDQHFFNSLAPIINNFDNYKKLVFRSRILELAMEIGDIQEPNRSQTAWSTAKQEPATYIVDMEDPK